MSRRSYALVAVILLMTAWGSTFAVTKVTVAEIPPLALAALRFLIAACVLAPIAIARGGLRRLPRPTPIAQLAWMALTGIATFHIAFNYALVHGSATQGALIFALVPVAVVAAAVLVLGEAPAKRRIIGIVLSVVGVAIVVAAGQVDTASPNPLLGGAWMLVAVATWAIYTVVAKRLADADQVVVIACVTVIGAIMLLPPAVVELVSGSVPTPSLQGWLGALFLGLIASALAFLVYSRVLRELDASLVGAFLNLDPIVGVVTAVVFLGETLHGGQIAGGVIALAGMWLASSESKKVKPVNVAGVENDRD